VANPEQLSLLKRSVQEWNAWRETGPTTVDLTEADLARCDLSGAKLQYAQLQNAHLEEARLDGVDLYGARLYGARLEFSTLNDMQAHYAEFDGAVLQSAFLARAAAHDATFVHANLKQADLSGGKFEHVEFVDSDMSGAALEGANFERATFLRTTLTGARMAVANLMTASFVGTDLRSADLRGCRTYGLSAWDVQLEGAEQGGLIITPDNTAAITVDHLEVAQFVYLILNNATLRDVIDTIRSKAVLILGRFTPERKTILDALRDTLRTRNYSPIVFDFDAPASLNFTGTVSTLARLARFVIADITDAKSIPQELMAIVPQLPSVPIQPLLLASSDEYAMFGDFFDFPSVLETVRYDDTKTLIANLDQLVIRPAEIFAETQVMRRQSRRTRQQPKA
jgi:uncharacterized protein YjbI with pentapeptide repeats